ncbi:TorF family putative porin [Crenothrix sp.]|uniref:TorF family putative porin n=1 Tax=Crenothrix sp. TaxID=3100433 RepID=UPI00374DEF53
MPKAVLSLQILCLVLLLYPATSCAKLRATVTMTTNNVQRWFTKSNNNVAAQANLDYQHSSGLYLGSSVSNIDFESDEHPDSSHVEIIPYLGWSFKLAEKWRIDAQWSRYLYDGEVFGHAADYNEYYLFVHYNDLFTGRISFSDDYYNVGHSVIDYQLTGKYPVLDNLEFSASFGYSQTQAALGSDYPYWNAGFTYYYKFLAVDLRYMDATETSVNYATEVQMHKLYNPPLLDSSVVFSISLGF